MQSSELGQQNEQGLTARIKFLFNEQVQMCLAMWMCKYPKYLLLPIFLTLFSVYLHPHVGIYTIYSRCMSFEPHFKELQGKWNSFWWKGDFWSQASQILLSVLTGEKCGWVGLLLLMLQLWGSCGYFLDSFKVDSAGNWVNLAIILKKLL